MTNLEQEPTRQPEYPYFREKIPVADGLEGFSECMERYPGFTFCPYVAEKDTEGWDVSTSRVYMNQVLPRFLYVPVNIPKDNLDALERFFAFTQDCENVPAVNITQPHKSSEVLRRMYLGDAQSDVNVDTLIRDSKGELRPYDLNSTAFVEWYKADVGSFEGKPVVLVGVGGVGEPIAKKIAAEHPKDLLLVDVADKTDFATRLSRDEGVAIAFSHSLRDRTQGLPEGVIVINAAGKEGATNESELWELIQKEIPGGTFVDIRPHLNIDVVEEARCHGWSAHTGHGMNARNDYVLLQGIADHIPGAVPPSFEEFQRLVAAAS